MQSKRFAVSVVLGLCLAMPALPACADDALPPGCAVSGTNIAQPGGKGDVTIICNSISEAFGNQLADVINRIALKRLDPQAVIIKLDEVGQLPEEGAARVIDENQRQRIIKSLLGKPPQTVAITAHPTVSDAADYALGVATALSQVGWGIEGQQIRRMAPKQLDVVTGAAIIVKSTDSPPPKAIQLRTALGAANIVVPFVSDPTMAPDAAMLWVGRRQDVNPDQPK
jgi:hypothetical protein